MRPVNPGRNAADEDQRPFLSQNSCQFGILTWRLK